MEDQFVVYKSNYGVDVKAWVKGVVIDPKAIEQLKKTADLSIVYPHVAVMPDVHVGIGATVGSVVPTFGAIIPAAVGVDIGCGMMAAKTSLKAENLPVSLKEMRNKIERDVPHGRTTRGRDKGAWGHGDVPKRVSQAWRNLEPRFENISEKHRRVKNSNNDVHLGTLGTGNHFIEVCLDENNQVWVVLHSGSRGVGNCIGTYFIELAKKDMQGHIKNLPDKDLAYFSEGSPNFDDYVEAVSWAQDFAMVNREIMMENVIKAIRNTPGVPGFTVEKHMVNCHHNYVSKEHHFGKDVFVTRKGAVKAGKGDWGIIPGSMGACSYIVQGLGNPNSFHSCSHGAGRTMSRTQAKINFTLDDHIAATMGVECRKDEGVIDETPMAYKDIDAVMEAQKDLVEIKTKLKQILCVKG
jgi:tRNA-splicing ligase RtcB